MVAYRATCRLSWGKHQQLIEQWVVQWNKMPILGKLINHHKDAIVMSRRREAFDEIHCNHFPWQAGHWKGLQEAWVRNSLGFSLLTDDTMLNKVFNTWSHARPTKKLMNAPIGHRKARVPPPPPNGVAWNAWRILLCSSEFWPTQMQLFTHKKPFFRKKICCWH